MILFTWLKLKANWWFIWWYSGWLFWKFELFKLFEQNECIETIPDGYYLDNKALGTIRECYYLCETCKGGLYIINSI